MSTAAAQMSFFTIDTLQFSKRMQKAGMPKEVSEELAEVIKEGQGQSIEKFATKEDLDNRINQSESKLEQKIDLVRKDIEALEHKLTVKLSKMIYTSTAMIITVIGLAIAVIKF